MAMWSSITTEAGLRCLTKVPIDMWECGYGSELTRRGGGDHEQRPKRVWGAKALTKQHRPQAAQAAPPLPRRARTK